MKRIRLTIKNDHQHVPLVTQCVAGLATDILDDDTKSLQTAVGTAIYQVVDHSYGTDRRGQIHIDLVLNEGEISVTIEDHGKGVDPDTFGDPATSPEISALRFAMDEVQYSRTNTINRLRMIKRRPPGG